MSDQQQVDPAQLAEAVKNMSDEEVAAAIKDMGVDNTLRNIFEGMRDSFKPSAAANVTSTVQYDITTDEGLKQWSVSFDNGTCSVSEGSASDPRLTIQVGLVDFVRLIFNQVQGPQLFMSGKMKLQGDMMWAMQMQNYFERNF
ncbi:MAG TPA: SCP2 sterol-binding domain-containing protein [Actinomycetota bacterium]|nr:SCP2 sterol-binding domain-containing protein [Actinomycetota bacterium]